MYIICIDDDTRPGGGGSILFPFLVCDDVDVHLHRRRRRYDAAALLPTRRGLMVY